MAAEAPDDKTEMCPLLSALLLLLAARIHMQAISQHQAQTCLQPRIRQRMKYKNSCSVQGACNQCSASNLLTGKLWKAMQIRFVRNRSTGKAPRLPRRANKQNYECTRWVSVMLELHQKIGHLVLRHTSNRSVHSKADAEHCMQVLLLASLEYATATTLAQIKSVAEFCMRQLMLLLLTTLLLHQVDLQDQMN